MSRRMWTSASLVLLFSAAMSWAAEPGDYLQDGKLAQRLTLSHVQTGGFAGLLEWSVAIDADGSWKGETKVGGRAAPRAGTLTPEHAKDLAALLAENELSGLPKIIGAAKPIQSPKNIADGASTTIRLSFGEQQITANFADGVEVDEATSKLRQRLFAIEAAVRKVTLNVPVDK